MTTAFVSGRVFTGDGKVLEHATVIVEGDRIVKVERERRLFPGARRRSPGGSNPFPGLHRLPRTSLPGRKRGSHDDAPERSACHDHLKACRLAHKTLNERGDHGPRHGRQGRH